MLVIQIKLKALYRTLMIASVFQRLICLTIFLKSEVFLEFVLSCRLYIIYLHLFIEKTKAIYLFKGPFSLEVFFKQIGAWYLSFFKVELVNLLFFVIRNFVSTSYLISLKLLVENKLLLRDAKIHESYTGNNDLAFLQFHLKGLSQIFLKIVNSIMRTI